MDYTGRMEEWIKLTTFELELPKARATLLHLKAQVDIARMQFQRLHEDNAKIDNLLKLRDEYNTLQSNLAGTQKEEMWKKTIETDWEWRDQLALSYADAQFLVVILARIYRLLEKLRKHLSRHVLIKDVRNKYRKWLEQYDEFRDDIEHMDEKIEEEMVDVNSHIIGIGYEFLMKRQGVDLNEKAEKQLDNFMRDLIQAFANERGDNVSQE